MIYTFSNARLVGASFARQAATTDTRIAGVVRHHGRLLQTRVRGRASGRPGPRVVTGDYRRSIDFRMSSEVSLGMHVAQVGTNNPQGRRLEMGFTGVDSLGRYYDQPPYPHFGPALDDTTPDFLSALADEAVST